MESIIILGKSDSGRECQFDTEEIWGVNNVADHPEHNGAISGMQIHNGGHGYTSPPIITFEGNGGAEAQVTGISQGVVTQVNLGNPGSKYETPPRVIFTGGGGGGAQMSVTISPCRKFTKLFAFDDLPQEYTDGMKKNAPICSWKPYKDIDYPLDDILKEFKSEYFTNTVSYMLAYAILLKPKVIKIYGVDTSFGGPYAMENRGVEYWVGRAQERGIEVTFPPTSHLLRTVTGELYGKFDNCHFLLYVYERLALINLLPQRGTYSNVIGSQAGHWVLMPKEDEARAHGVRLEKNMNGGMSYAVPKEYISDTALPKEVWDYLRKLLIDLEKRGELPYSAISVYEKLVLGKDSGTGGDVT